MFDFMSPSPFMIRCELWDKDTVGDDDTMVRFGKRRLRSFLSHGARRALWTCGPRTLT